MFPRWTTAVFIEGTALAAEALVMELFQKNTDRPPATNTTPTAINSQVFFLQKGVFFFADCKFTFIYDLW
jgi:hypothetical protein